LVTGCAAEWTSQQLAKLRSRADQLDTDEAFAAHIATANLLASMCEALPVSMAASHLYTAWQR